MLWDFYFQEFAELADTTRNMVTITKCLSFHKHRPCRNWGFVAFSSTLADLGKHAEISRSHHS